MTKLPDQFGQLRRLGIQRWGDKRAFHDTVAYTQNLAPEHRAVEPGKRFRRSFTVGQGALRGAQWTGIVRVWGLMVSMTCVLLWAW
jgi:hypothetical protein